MECRCGVATHPEADVFQAARILPQSVQNMLRSLVGYVASRKVDAQALAIAEPSDEARQFQGAGVVEVISLSLRGGGQGKRQGGRNLGG